MTEETNSNKRLSESDVEHLLQRFFSGEMPVEFRDERHPVVLARPRLEPLINTATPDASRSLAGLLAILVSATCCLVVTMFIPSESPPGSLETTASPQNGARLQTHPVVNKSVPIEDRSHLRYSSTRTDEHKEASESETSDPLVPELEIEIYPLRPDKPRE